MMAPLSEEEENYIRLALLLKGVSPRAVRTFFDKEFAPTYLPSTLTKNYNTLYDLFLKRILNQTQWNLLFPKKSVPDSKTFDVTLMICLIRNLTSIISPINGFDKLPLSGETTPGADLARIKWYRNILAHHESNTMTTTEFNTAWTNIADAVTRIGGSSLNQECLELKVKILDQSNQEIMLEIKQSQEEMKELKRTIDIEHSTINIMKENLQDLQDSHITLQTEHSRATKNLKEVTEILKDPVPWNMRGHIKEKLETWTENDKSFIETNGAKRVLECIEKYGCVVVTGSSGCGKSSLVRHVAIQMQNKGCEILPVSNPKELIKWHNPSRKTLFVVDDFCGIYTLNTIKYENWKNTMETIKSLVEKKRVKLIMSCRLQVYNDRKLKSLSLYQSCECNLLCDEMRLSKKEKQSIANFYLKTNASKIFESYDLFDCFPLLCQLYSKNTKLSIVNYFQNPFTVYKEELDKLHTEEANVKYCALALCVMFNNRLKEKWLTHDVDDDIKSIFRNTYEHCKVLEGTSRLILRDELDSLTQTFIKKDGDVYRTIHDKLFDYLAFYFGSVMIDCLINNATSRLIRERFLFERKRKSDEFIIIVPENYKEMYIKRMIDDWSKGNVVDVFSNINTENEIFTKRFLAHIKGLTLSQQQRLANSYDKNNKSSPLIQCCFIGEIDLVSWCLHDCICNVNHCRNDDRTTALYISCEKGYIKVVKMLISKKADINKCNDKKASPLYIACQNGHIEVVEMLLINKADINRCRDTGSSPLLIACHQGHTGVSQMLIKYNADINKCKDNGSSPLFIACVKGNNEIIRILINNKADINKCVNTGVSPLFIACQKGHTKVVEKLINNKADINKSDNEEVSPLYIACQKGHSDVVKMLINNKANINKCRDNGSSPLHIACREGHTKVVQILINKNADVNKCRKTGVSPIHVACRKGHTEIVKMLIHKEADITKCDEEDISPLYIACQKKHTDVVEILINNKANVNKCRDTGASPLYIACHQGHADVVQILIDNDADINKCRDIGASPLYIACHLGHTKVVQMLINSMADPNTCNDIGVSPLYIACQEGHTDVVKLLINNKADINKCMNTGETPLLIACVKSHADIVELLLNHKADCNIKWRGLTPLNIAKRENITNIVHLLER